MGLACVGLACVGLACVSKGRSAAQAAINWVVLCDAQGLVLVEANRVDVATAGCAAFKALRGQKLLLTDWALAAVSLNRHWGRR